MNGHVVANENIPNILITLHRKPILKDMFSFAPFKGYVKYKRLYVIIRK